MKPFPNIYYSESRKCIVKKITSKEPIEIRICEPIWIEKVYCNLDDNTITADILFLFLGEFKRLEVSREDYVNEKNVLKLQQFGFDVLHTNVKDVVCHLRNQEEDAEKIYTHSNLGIAIHNKSLIYKHHRIIGANIKSKYVGELKIKPRGSFEAWLAMYKEHISGFAPLELCCCISLSALIVSLLAVELGNESLLCHLSGNSTTGKSTALKLAISMFGYPGIKENGLFTTYNSTTNAMQKTLTGINGTPIAFDEISMINTKELNNLVYKLVSGAEKSRLNKSAELKKRSTWQTTILSTGEETIIQNSSNAGLLNRVLEFEGVKWTKNASHAEVVKECAEKNYGRIGTSFAELVLTKSHSQIKEIFATQKEKFHKYLNERQIHDNFVERRLKKYAAILTAGVIFEELIDAKLNFNEIFELLAEVEVKSIEKRNFDKTVSEFIYGQVLINIDKFDVSASSTVGPTDISAQKTYWGKITKKEGRLEIQFVPSIFEDIIKKGGYKSKNIVLNELAEAGMLDHESDRLYRKRLNNLNKQSKFYVLIIRDEGEDSTFDKINDLIDSSSDRKRRRIAREHKERMKNEKSKK